MLIRHLEGQHLDALLALHAHLHTSDDPLPSRALVEATWREQLASSRFRHCGAFVDGRLAANCSLAIVPNLTRGCRPYGVIENVVTDAAFRRRGLGRAVVALALQDAWGAGCYKVMLLTGRKDEGVLRFYEQAGFDRHGKQAFVARPPA